jgi:hypothetical protein
MKKYKFKWLEWRLCGPQENLFDLTSEELVTFQLICRGYYATRTI